MKREKKWRQGSKCRRKDGKKVLERQKRVEEGRGSEGSHCLTGNEKDELFAHAQLIVI